DEVKGPVVGDVLVPPVLLLAAVALATAARRSTSLPEAIKRAVLATGAAILLIGIAAQARALRTMTFDLSSTSDIAQASRFIDQLGAYVSAPRPGGPLLWTMDAHLGFAAAPVGRSYYYQQHHEWLP